MLASGLQQPEQQTQGPHITAFHLRLCRGLPAPAWPGRGGAPRKEGSQGGWALWHGRTPAPLLSVGPWPELVVICGSHSEGSTVTAEARPPGSAGGSAVEAGEPGQVGCVPGAWDPWAPLSVGS